MKKEKAMRGREENEMSTKTGPETELGPQVMASSNLYPEVRS